MLTNNTYINTRDVLSLAVHKIAKNLSQKEAKKTKRAESTLYHLFLGQISRGINATEHFLQRMGQRFEAKYQEEVSGAIARAVRNTQVIEQGGRHIAKSQRYIDENTQIVVVLEKRGVSGATLVTCYKRGEENLLTDDEYADLKSRGIL